MRPSTSEFLETSAYIVMPMMGVKHWDASVKVEPETVKVTFFEGFPVEPRAAKHHGVAGSEANKIGGRHGLA